MKIQSITKACLLMAAASLIGGCSNDSGDTEKNPESNTFIPNVIIAPEDDSKPAEQPPVVDVSACVDIDLAAPASTDDSVAVESKSGKLTLSVDSDVKKCIRLTGAFDGAVTIKNAQNVDIDLVLDNVHITSTENAGALKLKTDKAEQGNIYAVELRGENEIVGNATEDCKKVLACDTNLSLTGDGSLSIWAHYKTGIAVDDVFHLYSGHVSVNVDRADTAIAEKGFGVKVTHGFAMSGGSLAITARDSATMTGVEARGLKVDGADCELVDDQVNAACYGKGKGFIRISGGNLTIDSDAKAVSAGWDIDEDLLSKDTSDDPSPDVEISGGIIHITTYGTPREDNDPNGSLSPEGIEGKNAVRISGGEIIVKSTDDAIQAGKLLEISGGKISAWATANDAMDSNSKAIISGGLIAALGANSPEGGLDADFASNVSYTGGILIAIGGSNNPPSNADSTFVQLELSGSANAGPGQQPGGPGQQPGGPGQQPGGPGQQPGGPGQQPSGPGQNGGMSAAAGKTLALTAQGDSAVLAAIKVPSDYAGGSNVLVLHPELVSGSIYSLHEADSLTENPAFTWFNDMIMNGNATVTSQTTHDQTAGTAVGGMGGPGGRP